MQSDNAETANRGNGATEHRRAPGRRMWLIGGLIGLVLVVAGVVVWATTDRAVYGYGNSQVIPQDVGQAAIVEADVATPIEEHHHVTVRALKVRIVTNTSRATVEVVVANPSDDTLTDVSGLPQFSSGTLPSSTTRRLYLRITPHQAGVLDIHGIDVSYREGIRFGWRHAGIHTVIRTSA